ncbi:MAG: DUF4352 domain-containing protein [Chloroflexi bacterium]|nr:DUF4352 domain-containing protein [Chloroflexota bacterium]
MNTLRHISLRSLFVPILLVGLVAAACSPSATPTTAVRPTSAPVQPTRKPAPTTAPTTKPQPTAVPTQKPAPTAAPTTVPTTAPTAAPKITPLGTAQTVESISILPSKIQMLPQSGQDKPKVGDEYLVISLTIQNQDQKASLQFDPAKLVLVNAGGADFSIVTLKSLTNELKAMSLKPGQKIEGVVAFEIPQKNDKWNLEFKSGNKNEASWSLAG